MARAEGVLVALDSDAHSRLEFSSWRRASGRRGAAGSRRAMS
jgi:hypothetical protein